MYWLIGIVLLCTLLLIWPHWIGGEIRGNVQRIIWIIPPFRLTISRSRIRLFLFSKPIKQFAGDKQRRKKILKERNKLEKENRENSKQKKNIKPQSESVKPHNEISDKNTDSDINRNDVITKVPSSIIHSAIPNEIKSESLPDEVISETVPKQTTSETIETSNTTVSSKTTTENHSSQNLESLEQVESVLELKEKRKKKISIFQKTKNSIKTFFQKLKKLWADEKVFLKKNVKWIKYFLKISWKLIRPTSFHIDFCGGFDDPSYTGFLSGTINSIWPTERGLSKNHVSYTPQFINSTPWEYEGDIIVRTSVGSLLLWLTLSLITFPYFQGYKFYKRHKEDS